MINSKEFTVYIMAGITITVSLAAVFLFMWMGTKPEKLGGICGLSFGGVVLSLLLGSSVLLLQVILTVFALLICFAFHWNRRTVNALVVASAFMSYAFVIGMPIVERKALLEEFPFESISSRLEYERTGKASPQMPTDAASQFSGEVQTQLEVVEHRGVTFRNILLRNLHVQTLDSFILAQEFGSGRIPSVSRNRIVLPDKGPIPFESLSPREMPSPLHASPNDTSDHNSKPATLLPEKRNLASMHREGLEDFLSTGRMGYIQDRDHVAGFLSHRFTQMPGPDDKEWRKEWGISRLELIGILKYDQPQVYVSSNLPRMDELIHAPVRDLDGFEAMALARLRSQEDLVIDDRTNSIRMVGSLRAAEDCRRCHEVRRGELLGALTYELVPTNNSHGR